MSSSFTVLLSQPNHTKHLHLSNWQLTRVVCHGNTKTVTLPDLYQHTVYLLYCADHFVVHKMFVVFTCWSSSCKSFKCLWSGYSVAYRRPLSWHTAMYTHCVDTFTSHVHILVTPYGASVTREAIFFLCYLRYFHYIWRDIPQPAPLSISYQGVS